MNKVKRVAFIILIGIAVAVIPFQVQSPEMDQQEKWESLELEQTKPE
ncbi:hypothetical protein [Thalassobacillus devorans]|nr:hypothetical protein [Thalassobacillus devorans]